MHEQRAHHRDLGRARIEFLLESAPPRVVVLLEDREALERRRQVREAVARGLRFVGLAFFVLGTLLLAAWRFSR